MGNAMHTPTSRLLTCLLLQEGNDVGYILVARHTGEGHLRAWHELVRAVQILCKRSFIPGETRLAHRRRIAIARKGARGTTDDPVQYRPNIVLRACTDCVASRTLRKDRCARFRIAFRVYCRDGCYERQNSKHGSFHLPTLTREPSDQVASGSCL